MVFVFSCKKSCEIQGWRWIEIGILQIDFFDIHSSVNFQISNKAHYHLHK